MGAARSGPAGRKAKELISSARESLARMLGGRPEDIVFASGGTEVGAGGTPFLGIPAHQPLSSKQ